MESHEKLINDLIANGITGVTRERFQTILNHYEKISKVKGDIIECGCWKGGFSIFLSHLFKDKNIWVADSFKGFQPLGNAKYPYDKERHTEHYNIGVSLQEAQSHFNAYGFEGDPRIKFLEGFVKDTLPTSGIKKLALLRIDVDAYSATLEILDELYDKVAPGGYVVFDDSCLYETVDAIKVFFAQKNLPNHILHPVTDEKLDLSERHAESDSGFPCGCYIIKDK